MSHTAGRQRSAASVAAFVPSDFPISSGLPPTVSSSGPMSSHTQRSIPGSNGFAGCRDHECWCTVASRRSTTAAAYMSRPAAGPNVPPGTTTASATPETLPSR